MNLLDATAALLVLAAGFGFLNYHLLKLPFTIGQLLGGLIASFGVLAVDALAPSLGIAGSVRDALVSIDFAHTVLNGMLSILLFAGALHTDLGQLKQKVVPIATLASVGVLISTAIAGAGAYFIFQFFGVNVHPVWCLVFGALISPTDPIAVLGIMKRAKAPKTLEVKVIGESLFNDGTAVVAFTVLVGVGVALGSGSPDAAAEASSAGHVAWLLAKEVLGGIVVGLFCGIICYLALKTMDEASLEILVSVATIFGLSMVATKLHVSAPLAAVVAGLFVGHRGRGTMSERTARDLDIVWTFVDEILNALLFLLIGLEVLAIDHDAVYLYAGFGLVVAVLFARYVSVALPITILRKWTAAGPGAIRVLTWGGLKGGVSVALAMKLPEFEGRSALITAAYVVVVFSIVVQGLTVGALIRRVVLPMVAAEPQDELLDELLEEPA